MCAPNQAAEHYYLLTEPMASVDASWPVIEDPARHTFIRPEGGGLMVGLFEPDAARPVVEMMSRELDALQPLTLRDVALLLQWTAPGGLLDAAPTPPRVRREDVLAVTSGDRDETVDALDALLSAASASESPVVLREAAEGHERTGLFLDLPGHPKWSPLVRVAERVELALGDLVVSRSS